MKVVEQQLTQNLRDVKDIAPTNGQFLVWNSTFQYYEPINPPEVLPMGALNLLANPGFELDQKNASPYSVTLRSTADRWILLNPSAKLTVSWSNNPADVLQSSGSLKLVFSASATDHYVYQFVDSFKVIEYAGRKITFAMDLKSSVGSSAYIQLAEYDGSTWKWDDSTYHTGDGTWQRLTVTHNIRTTAIKIEFRIRTNSASAHTIMCDNGVALFGQFSTLPYMPLPADIDLLRCKRHYDEGQVIDSSESYRDGANLYHIDAMIYLAQPMPVTSLLVTVIGSVYAYNSSVPVVLPGGYVVTTTVFQEYKNLLTRKINVDVSHNVAVSRPAKIDIKWVAESQIS